MMYCDIEEYRYLKEEEYSEALLKRIKKYQNSRQMFQDFVSGEYNTEYFTMVNYDELGNFNQMIFDIVVNRDEEKREHLISKFFAACEELAKEDFVEIDEDEVES